MDYNKYQHEELDAIVNPSEDELNILATPGTLNAEIDEKLDRLIAAAEADKKLMEGFTYDFGDGAANLHRYIIARLCYMGMSLRKSTVEYPSVVNELNYLLTAISRGAFKSCGTAHLLKQFAAESLADRKLKKD